MRFTYKQLAAWRDIAFDEVLTRIPGVSSLDLDEARNRIAIGVLPSTSNETRGAALSALIRSGVDTSAVIFDQVGGHINDAPPSNLDGSASDLLAGGLRIDVQHPDATWHMCSLGFPATRSGTQGFVTASHCTSGTYGPDNNLVAQILPRQVGTESVDSYGYTCGFFSECRSSDAAFVASNGAVPMGEGLIMRTTFPNGGGLSGGNGSTNVDPQNPYFIVTAEENNSLPAGMEVHKVGRTTGWTRGAIKQTCVDHYLPGNHLIRCAYEAWYVANGGDSGAPVWLYDSYSCSRCVQLAGIHNGRAEPGNDQARFSKLARIKSDLGGTWTIMRSKSLTAPIVSGSVSSGRAVLSWNAVPSAVLYNVWVYFQEYLCDPDIGCIWRDRYEKLGETSGTTFTDPTAFVSSYSGGIPTGAPGERRYWVIAESVTDLSPQSASRYFQP